MAKIGRDLFQFQKRNVSFLNFLNNQESSFETENSSIRDSLSSQPDNF